eukprot:TRINITY_DN123108_c0_g1_i1.p1 TRINITY_DN123108_c0_g1~~TRINITY_DN123108_c0_g1_i1.p1  ORF type:complete len:318 (-),score=49.47 TRINITY_DN123108_c0_g1_i1:44-997(-)
MSVICPLRIEGQAVAEDEAGHACRSTPGRLRLQACMPKEIEPYLKMDEYQRFQRCVDSQLEIVERARKRPTVKWGFLSALLVDVVLLVVALAVYYSRECQNAEWCNPGGGFMPQDACECKRPYVWAIYAFCAAAIPCAAIPIAIGFWLDKSQEQRTTGWNGVIAMCAVHTDPARSFVPEERTLLRQRYYEILVRIDVERMAWIIEEEAIRTRSKMSAEAAANEAAAEHSAPSGDVQASLLATAMAILFDFSLDKKGEASSSSTGSSSSCQASDDADPDQIRQLSGDSRSSRGVLHYLGQFACKSCNAGDRDLTFSRV